MREKRSPYLRGYAAKTKNTTRFSLSGPLLPLFPGGKRGAPRAAGPSGEDAAGRHAGG